MESWEKPWKFYLYRVRINKGGYTSSGQYFGIHNRIYYFEPVDGSTFHGDHGYLRCNTREEAKNMVATVIPNATFFK